MTTPVNIVVRERGSQETSSKLNRVRTSLVGIGAATKGTFSSILGASLLTGLLGGGLISLALSGGEASNSLIRLQSIMEELIRPMFKLLEVFLDWFETLSPLQQGLLILATILLWLGRRVIFGVLFGIAKAIISFIGFWYAVFRVFGIVSLLSIGLTKLGAFLGTTAGIVGSVIVGVLLLVLALYFLETRFRGVSTVINDYIIRPLNAVIQKINQVITAFSLLDDVATGRITIQEAGRAVRAAGGDIFARSAEEGSRIPIVNFSAVQQIPFRLPGEEQGEQRQPISGFRLPTVPLVPQIPINQQNPSGFFRQPDQGIFDLTPLEQRPIDAISDLISRVFGSGQQNVGNNNIYHFGVSQDQISRDFNDLYNNPNIRSRANGGP